MDILFHVSTAGGGQLLTPLAAAAARAGIDFGAFFTHDGVIGLGDPALLAALATAQRAVVCEESWQHHFPELRCPVEAGSQTINSALMGTAKKVVSL